MTFKEYINNVKGTFIDYDGVYGVQCFDLVNDYIVKVLGAKPFIGKGADEIYNNYMKQPSKDKFLRIPNSPEFIPQEGDIIVWSNTLNGTVGHCAIATGEGTTEWFTSWEQNWTGNGDCTAKIRHDYSHVLGVLRPVEFIASKLKEGLKEITKELTPVTKNGIDISRYQYKPDFSKVKDAVDFVIVQAGFGRYSYQVDDEFERSYAECKKYGIPIGAYWFSYAVSVEDAKNEARACLEVIKDKQFEYPIYFDIEGDACHGDVSGKCQAFCDELEKAGYFAGIYISRSPAQQYLTEFCRNNYALWLAEYGNKLNWDGPVGMWQNSSAGRIPGIGTDVDTNFCYVDYPTIIKEGGYNGFNTAPGLETLDTVGFKKGYKELGVLAYKQLLILAHNKGVIKQKVDNNNSFGDGTEKATNEFLGLLNKNQNGIAGANTIKALGAKMKEVK